MEEKNVRRGDLKKGFPWFGLGFLILVGAIVGSFFTNIPAKVARNLKEIAAPKPQPGPDEETLALQIEQRLREEFEDKLKQELAALKQVKPKQETPPAPEPPPELPSGTMTDVRELRSGIPFKTKVTFEEGKTAVTERSPRATPRATNSSCACPRPPQENGVRKMGSVKMGSVCKN
jgi:hypothetical protein